MKNSGNLKEEVKVDGIRLVIKSQLTGETFAEMVDLNTALALQSTLRSELRYTSTSVSVQVLHDGSWGTVEQALAQPSA